MIHPLGSSWQTEQGQGRERRSPARTASRHRIVHCQFHQLGGNAVTQVRDLGADPLRLDPAGEVAARISASI
jgi:hypothetical protein